MASGISVEAGLKEEYNLLKSNKHTDPMQLLVMQISSDKTQIVKVPDLCKKTCSVAELQEFVSDKDRKTICYYLLFDWKCKLYLIKWVPDTAPVKEKMLYASSFDAIKKACDGVKGIVEASEPDDLEEKELASAKS